MDSVNLQKLRIFAMLMRAQEIKESKIRRIHFVNESINHVRVLGIGMDFGQVIIIENPIEEKKPFKPFNIPDYEVFLSNDTPSKYFGKPKNNFKK